MLNIIRNHYLRFSKFTIVGIGNTAIDFSVFYMVFEVFGAHFMVAHIVAFFVALMNSFVFNALWTFKNLQRAQMVRQILRFFVIGVIGLCASALVIFIAQNFVNMYIAKIMAMAVSLCWNYLGSWLFVFKDSP